MAKANGSGDQRRAEDEQPERSPEVQAVVDKWFSDSDDEQGGGR
jgi:hypothetical protein